MSARGGFPEPSTRASGAETDVLHVIARMNLGGPAVAVAALCTRLPSHGFSPAIACGRVGEGEDEHHAMRTTEVPVARIPSLRPELDPIADARALVHLIRLM